MPKFSHWLSDRVDLTEFDRPVRVVGIDLGTTNSTVAEITYDPHKDGSPIVRCLEIDQHTAEGVYTHVLVPSVVAVQGVTPVVGEGAKRLRAVASERHLEQNKDVFWECKNDMGLRRTYHRAPTGFRSAKEIAGHVLAFLNRAIRCTPEQPIDRVVVTVPASFQAAQRQDTREAGRLAGLELVSGDLLDEPIAAFLDQLVCGQAILVGTELAKNLVVFDFGGGTCDVAILRVTAPKNGGPPQVSPLAVSRYHRLGGGDIDAAIVYDVLLPQILQQNTISPHDLTFTEKKRWIEPAFLGVAESLKVGLSSEMDRLAQFGKYPTTDRAEVFKKLPGVYQCRLPDNRVLRLQSPALNADQFERLLVPFLDRDLLYPQQTEYCTTCSIFSPLGDALNRAGLSPADVNFCLLVGGSTLLPPVRQAIADYFPNAKQLTPGGPDAVQTSVARGAALHALALALTGRGLVQPVAADRIALRTTTEGGGVRLKELVPRSAPLPYPRETRWVEVKDLTVPRSSGTEPVDLRIELVDSDENVLGRWVTALAPPVREGDPMLLRVRMDENQLLELSLSLPANARQKSFEFKVENPLTNVVNPQEQRQQVEELEETLRTGQVPKDQIPDALVELADLYEELGQRERALDLLQRVLQARGRPDANVLNQMGILCEAMRDTVRAERLYRESARHARSGAPLFNLVLLFKKRGELDQALSTIDEALEREKDPPYLVLKAQIAAALQNPAVRDTCLDEALRLFATPESLSEWALHWFELAAQMTGNVEALNRAKAIRQQRTRTPTDDQTVAGDLPKLVYETEELE